jgi:hypothetical protein
MMDNQTGSAFLSSVIIGPISDYNDLKGKLLSGCHWTNQSIGTSLISAMSSHAVGQPSISHNPGVTFSACLRDSILDKELHYDFTNISDDGRTFFRGGSIYNRPCGWKRYALNVKGKFSNNIWLEGKTPRDDIYSSAEGEWAVSYHGTPLKNGLCIGEEGYKLSKGKNFKYGKGIYSTPDIEVAYKYAVDVPFNGKTYKFVVQNRVNPKNLKKVSEAVTGVGEYWISPTKDDIRPYGFCVKQI